MQPIPTTTTIPKSEQVSADEVVVSDVTENSVVVSWKTKIPSISKIVYGGKTLFDGAVTTDHRIVLSGLMPDTLYRFQIVGQADKGEFRTRSQGFDQVQEELLAESEKQRGLLDRFPGGIFTILIFLVFVVGLGFLVFWQMRK